MAALLIYGIPLLAIALLIIIGEILAISRMINLLKSRINRINTENNLRDSGNPYRYANAILIFYTLVFLGSFLYIAIKLIENLKEGILIVIIFDIVLIIFGVPIYLSYAILKKTYSAKR